MVPPHGVGGEAVIPLYLGIVLLDVLRRQLQKGHIPQGRAQVIVNDLLIGIHRGFCPIGPHDGVHPVFQPLGQGELMPGGLALLIPMGQEIPQSRPGGGQGGKGTVLLDPPALLITAQVHTDVVQIPGIVV